MLTKRVLARMVRMTRNYVANPTLRDYQVEAIHNCTDAIDSGIMRLGVSMATGGGKTVVFANLIDCMKQRSKKKNFTTLVLVHRRELALQARNAIEKYCPNEEVGIEMSALKADVEDSDIIVASVQSLIRRLDKYKSTDIDMIIIDEAHHCVANTYVNILKHFNANTKDTKIPVIGFSATFERTDNKRISDVLDKIVYHKGILDMIENKWLCEGKFTTVKVNTDLSRIEGKLVGKDFDLRELSKVMNVPEVNHIILAAYLKKRREHDIKSSLLFGIDIAHVKALHKIFQSNGIKSMYVTSGTNNDERQEIIDDFKAGEIEVLMNCGIFTEGTDIPNIDCILLCRPTRSRPLLVQMIGRGLRLHDSKKFCHIIDFINTADVGVVSVPDLAGLHGVMGPLDDKTLDEMKEIKENMEKEKEMQQQKEAQKTKELAQEHGRRRDAYYKKFQEMVAKFDALELTMTTYDSMVDFFKQSEKSNATEFGDMSLLQKENKVLFNSKRPWIKFQKDAWALSLCNGSHFRLYKEKSRDHDKDDVHYIYVLKMFREIPSFSPAEQVIRFSSNDVTQSDDILEITNTIEYIISSLQEGNKPSSGKPSRVDVSKYSKWRKDRPSQKQSQYVKRLLKQQYTKESWKYTNLTTDMLEEFVMSMHKGAAADIIFSASIASVYPIRKLLEALDYKENMKLRIKLSD